MSVGDDKLMDNFPMLSRFELHELLLSQTHNVLGEKIALMNKAEAILRELYEKAPVVYGIEHLDHYWGKIKHEDDNCTARLFFIEEIKKECVEHEPVRNFDEHSERTWSGKHWKCKHCGKPLKARWEIADE